MMYYPTNLYRLILNSQNIFNTHKNDMSDLEPYVCITKINKMILPSIMEKVILIICLLIILMKVINYSFLIRMYLSLEKELLNLYDYQKMLLTIFVKIFVENSLKV